MVQESKEDSIKKERAKHLTKRKLYLQENAIETAVRWLSNSVIYDPVKDDQNEHLK